MKPAFILAIVLASIIYFPPWSKGEQYSANSQQQASKESASTDNQKHSTTEASAPNNKTPEWYKSPEWVLVIVGSITAIVIGHQSWAFKLESIVQSCVEAGLKGETPAKHGSTLVMYRLIEYSDGVSDKTYKTAFCYRHQRQLPSEMSGRMVLCGPCVYNEYT